MNAKNRLIMGLIAVLLAGFVTTPVQAKKRNVCKADIKKFCGDIKPGEGRIIACLKKNIKKISARCKRNLELKKKKFPRKNRRAHSARKAFLRGFEKGFAKGFKRGFKVRLRQKGKRGKKLARACSRDIKKLCNNVKPGKGRIKNCLEENKNKLTDRCLRKLKKVAERAKRKK